MSTSTYGRLFVSAIVTFVITVIIKSGRRWLVGLKTSRLEVVALPLGLPGVTGRKVTGTRPQLRWRDYPGGS